MSEHSEEARNQPRAGTGTDSYEAVASEVLSRVVQESPSLRAATRSTQINLLCEAAVNPDPLVRDAVIADLTSDGLDRTALIDELIPAAARELGQRWREDRVSFADVTIGVARLQGILREMAGRGQSLIYRGGSGGMQVAMIVPEDEHHTLGALVATNQMRREGRTVRLILGKSPGEVAEDVIDYGVDVAMVSASVTTRLESVQLLVETIRLRTRGAIPIVVGGSILSHHPNVKTVTGADHTSTDPKEALTLCEQMIQCTGGGKSAPSD